jgi:formimidoylglutamate deiminase
VLISWNEAGTITAVAASSGKTRWLAICQPPLPDAQPAFPCLPARLCRLTEYRHHPTDSFWSWRQLMYAQHVTLRSSEVIATELHREMLAAGATPSV